MFENRSWKCPSHLAYAPGLNLDVFTQTLGRLSIHLKGSSAGKTDFKTYILMKLILVLPAFRVSGENVITVIFKLTFEVQIHF